MTQNADAINPVEHGEPDDFQRAITDNDKIIAQYDRKYSESSRQPSEWRHPGSIRHFRQQKNVLWLECEFAQIELFWLTSSVLRKRIHPGTDQFPEYFSYHAVNVTTNLEKLVVSETDEFILVYLENFTYEISRQDATIKCLRSGQVVWQETLAGTWADYDDVRLQMALVTDEACFGTGERSFNLNLRGRHLTVWNIDPAGYHRGDDPVNYHVSFYLCTHKNYSYGLLWDNPARTSLDLGHTDEQIIDIVSKKGPISVYYFAGRDVADVLTAYTSVTGRMKLPPLWALGVHQSRYSYMNADEVLAIAQEMRDRNIPCDVLYLDIHYMDGYKIFTWDKTSFPDMPRMIEQLHSLGMKLVVIMDPGVKVEPGYEGYENGLQQGIFITYPDGKPAAGVVWPGLCHFPDFTNPAARNWWKAELAQLLATGIDGIWNDMNEPLLFQPEGKTRSIPDYAVQSKEGRGGTHVELHNVYGMLMGKASLEALDQARPGKRQFNIIRAGAAGAQRYASSWTGDNFSTWDDLKLSISMSLQMGLSGIPFTGADVGGFGGDTNAELLTRWVQAASLMPFFRNHSAYGTARQEPWAFGEPYEQIIRSAIELRYRLLPYLYTTFAQAAFNGHPIIGPLFMAEPGNHVLHDVDDCYLLGDKILVAPVLEKAAIRRIVYLPEGDWYDFHSNKRHSGGQVISVEAPLDRLPLFIKSGTVLPTLSPIQHTGEAEQARLILRIYADTGVSTLYEDAGEGLEYLSGHYRWTSFDCHETSHTLLITKKTEGNFTPQYHEIEVQVIGASQEIQSVLIDGELSDNYQHQHGVMTAVLHANFHTIQVSI